LKLQYDWSEFVCIYDELERLLNIVTQSFIDHYGNAHLRYM